MPEDITEEQTRNAFALMRAETLTHIRPPGTAAAQRTVRNRRRTGIAALAAGVGIVVAGGFAVTHLATSERSATPPAAPSPSPSPSELPAEQLDRMAATAAAALGITSVDNKQRRREGKGPILMIGSEPARRGGISGTGYNENKTGIYVLDVLCVGEGTLRTRFWAATSGADEAGNPAPIPPDAAEAQVPCSDKPERVSLSVRAPWPKKVYVSIEPDQAAEGRAAHASLVRVP
ncbi:hypothetical protein [Micromonospora chalcea]|uniref:hypothetical protein n=1 Tax=Micromonospora chalcea TaxID=1874 RepID=UPI0033FC7344